ncbi:MAG: hypothetical protein ACOY0T_15890 [Myxococcota bacterium]
MSGDLATRALTLALIAIIVPLALRAMSGKGAATGRVRYSTAARWIVALCGLFMLVAAAVATASSRTGDARGALVLGALAALGIGAALEFWGVNHSYDNKGIEYRSPWSRHRSVAWSEINELKWRSAMKWLDLVPAEGRVIHLSPMLAGLDGLASIALDKVPEAARSRDPEALAALRLMANGAASALITDARRPSVIAADLVSRSARPEP